MRKITKEIPKVTTVTTWQATDGTEFTDETECRKYESSALGVIRGKLSKLIASKEVNAWDLMGGYEDNSVVAVIPSNKEDVDTILQFIYLTNPFLLESKYKERKEKIENIVRNAYKNNDVVLLGINYDNEYYFINSRENIINNLNNITNNDSKESN